MLHSKGVNDNRPDCGEHAIDEAMIVGKSSDFFDLTCGEMLFIQIDRIIPRQNRRDNKKTDVPRKKVYR